MRLGLSEQVAIEAGGFFQHAEKELSKRKAPSFWWAENRGTIGTNTQIVQLNQFFAYKMEKVEKMKNGIDSILTI